MKAKKEIKKMQRSMCKMADIIGEAINHQSRMVKINSEMMTQIRDIKGSQDRNTAMIKELTEDINGLRISQIDDEKDIEDQWEIVDGILNIGSKSEDTGESMPGQSDGLEVISQMISQVKYLRDYADYLRNTPWYERDLDDLESEVEEQLSSSE
ncbi:MAG: hypothetical protein K6B14_02330 [Lachnospiraceae bacterium]|nr:hypothetical protein [Lachnospiraceae bacterium]